MPDASGPGPADPADPAPSDAEGPEADGSGERGYVHDPEDLRPHQAPPSEEFDWRGWLLVGVIVVCFLVVPGVILYLPQAEGFIAGLGLTLRDAYLVLPLLPALLLGAVAVWAALHSRFE